MPSIGQNLQPFTGNGDVSKWVNVTKNSKQTINQGCFMPSLLADRFWRVIKYEKYNLVYLQAHKFTIT